VNLTAGPWPSLAFLALLALGAMQREPATAHASAAHASTAHASAAHASTAHASTAHASAAHASAPASSTTATDRVVRDLAYGPHARQRFDLYPPTRPQGAPTIFFVHGGGWRNGDKAGLQTIGAKAERWTAAGAFVVSTNYRLLPDADPLEQARDVARALAKAQSVVASRGGDPRGFVLMGHSAGAHLVALLAASPALVREAGAQPWRASVLLDAGSVDVVATMNSRRGRLPLFDDAFGDDPGFWREVSPMHRLSTATAPVLAVCAEGRRDSCDDNRGFVEKARALGGRAELMPTPLNHMQINRELGENNAYTRSIEAFLRSVGVTIGG
jgi:acetyl esterase/lipase